MFLEEAWRKCWRVIWVAKEYKILNILGAGKYSTVNLAERLNDNIKLAIKISKGATYSNVLQKEYEVLMEIDDYLIPKAIYFH